MVRALAGSLACVRLQWWWGFSLCRCRIRINYLPGGLIANQQQSQAVLICNQTLWIHNAAMLNASSLTIGANREAKFIYKVLKVQVGQHTLGPYPSSLPSLRRQCLANPFIHLCLCACECMELWVLLCGLRINEIAVFFCSLPSFSASI